MDNTRDLMDFGTRELRIAAMLLSALKSPKDYTFRLGEKVALEFNSKSGLVFLVDDNFNVAMLNGDRLEDWLICPQCNAEGFRDTLENKTSHSCCKAYAKQELQK
jgi:hypothetical protein